LYSHTFIIIVTIFLFPRFFIILDNQNLWLGFHDSFRKHNSFRVDSLFFHHILLLFLLIIKHIKHLQYKVYKSKMKNKKIYGSQPNRTLNYILCLYFILNLCVCKNQQASNLHQILELHFNFFPSKSNLKIKLMICLHPIQLINHFHLALLNLCHSLSNILFCRISAIHSITIFSIFFSSNTFP